MLNFLPMRSEVSFSKCINSSPRQATFGSCCDLRLHHTCCLRPRQGKACTRLRMAPAGLGKGGSQGQRQGEGLEKSSGIRCHKARKMLTGDLPLAAFRVFLVWAAISCPPNVYVLPPSTLSVLAAGTNTLIIVA